MKTPSNLDTAQTKSLGQSREETKMQTLLITHASLDAALAKAKAARSAASALYEVHIETKVLANAATRTSDAAWLAWVNAEAAARSAEAMAEVDRMHGG